MNKESTLLWGAIMGGISVALGAVGAHALKPALLASGRVETFELAVRYQFYHALALLLTGVVMSQTAGRSLRYCTVCFLSGIVFFSGSLYGLCFSQGIPFHYITPFGGIFFILGWIFLALGVYKKK